MSFIIENLDSREDNEEKSSLIAALQEFKKSYQDKIKAFDSYGSDNCILQAKINFQQEWINDLTEQNEMLVRTVEELEQEATERVLSLEEKLKQSSQSANEVMNGYSNISLNLNCTFKEIGKLQSDVRNLVNLVNRARDGDELNLDEFEFYTVSKKDLIINTNNLKRRKNSIPDNEVFLELEEKNLKIGELENKLENLEKNQTCLVVKEKYNLLKQSMLDMRDALTAEVADKHDIILSLRRDVQILEEQCRKADQQTHFKDDIIKELRKENKQLKQDLAEKERRDGELGDEICKLEIKNIQVKEEWEIQEKQSEFKLNEYKNMIAVYQKKLEDKEECIKILQEEIGQIKITFKNSIDSLDSGEQTVEHKQIQQEKEWIVESMREDTNQIKMLNEIEVNSLKSQEKRRTPEVTYIELEVNQNKQESADESTYKTVGVQEIDSKISFDVPDQYLTTEIFSENTELEVSKSPIRERCIRFVDETFSGSYNLNYIKEVPDGFLNSSKESISTKSILKSETQSLKEVVNNLQDSVTQLITKETDSLKIRDRIKELEQQVQKNSEKDELIEVQNETLNIIETELQAWRLKEIEVEAARNCREQEINNLKQIIDILSKNLENEKARSENLQKAVDLYQNSIGTLQENEGLLRKEIMDQKFTISNLQDALVTTKQVLEDYRQKSNQQIAVSNDLCTKLWTFTLQTDEDIKNLFMEKSYLIKLVNSLCDENLMLEVKLFYSYQDIEVYEIRLLKYQSACKFLESENLELKQKMVVLKHQKEEQDSFITDISDQLYQCKNELQNLFTVLNEEQCVLEDESASMNKHIMVLQAELFTLSEKLTMSVNCLQNEKETNNYLQIEHAKKAFEINCLKNELIMVNEKLKEAAAEILNLKEKALLLEYRLQSYEDAVSNLDRESHICQQNVLHCIENMNVAKENYRIKVAECEKLRKQYEEDCIKMERIEEELETLKSASNNNQTNIKSLKEKISTKEIEIKKLSEELSISKKKLAESIRSERYLQQTNESLQTDLNDKISNLESEKRHLVRVIEGNDKRINFLNSELCRKDTLLEEANNSLSGLYSTHESNVQNYQDSVLDLKNEINNLLQAKDTIHAENDNLRRQVERLHVILNENKEKETLTSDELQRCLCHLESIEKEKETLLKQNEELTKKNERLQNTCDLRVAHLEEKLSNSQSTRDNLRLESKNVIHTVKAWLDEQRQINTDLTKKLEEKNSLIASINEEKLILQNKIKKLSVYFNSNSGNRVFTPNRTTSSITPAAEGFYSLSSIESPDYSSGESDFDTTNLTPNVFVERVESLTDEVQRASFYWKNKIRDKEHIVSRDK